MIAIPIKTNKENSAVSPLFGKAKYFALANNGDITIVKNEVSGGRAVVSWLKSLGVNKLITSHMGQNPFNMLVNSDMKVYFAGNERVELNDILLKYADGDLIQLNHKNFDLYIKEDGHEHSHSHGDSGKSCCGKKNNKHINNLVHNHIQSNMGKTFHFKG
ncbi:NifB/NifX family molybdenum-iron cluster-binding protein [Arcobacter sp. FWKO B]|uniref:NifB/NifX family molybdenum-iron cluster-binding protein n=1 Tax=Arcobacter sp. FWKO B TaxID=2593672 RepID=UPI0018A6107C|nr:NifB/NifX family molybdenum-iron cluster-binding protein [Arcobacter sp. FWKO B]QOG11900.1 dinitrogenase [Arcobacter sp. FWKO B]